MNNHKLGLVFGIFFGSFHAVWSLLVAVGVAQPLMDWILGLHRISMTFTVLTFDLMSAVILVIVTGAMGYVAGWSVGYIWNWSMKASQPKY